MMVDEDDYLMMSGLQHFDFCRRQWALIHVEQQWKENLLTTEGALEHSKCHDDSIHEKRGKKVIFRGMRVVSHRLKLTGVCDVVEFHASEDGVSLTKYEGKWKPYPIEYKHGHTKSIDADRLQLCAQVMALEEMLCCDIEEGYLYYEETKRREKVVINDELRRLTIIAANDMNKYFDTGYTPKVKTGIHCKSCSLVDICIPKLNNKLNSHSYVRKHMEEE